MTTRTALITLFIVGVFGWVFLITSCNHGATVVTKGSPELPKVADEGTSVGDASKTVGDVSKDVGARADKIDGHADAVSAAVPPEAKPKTDPEIKGIKEETKGLRADQATLAATEQKLKETQNRLLEEQKKIDSYTDFAKNAEVERAKLEAKIKDLQSSNAKLLKTMLAWIIAACVVGIGACLVIGFFFKTPSAFMIAAGCVATLGVAVAVTMYLSTIAWIALAVLGVGFVGAVVYVVFQIRNRDVAVKELVHTGEVAKTYMPASVREKIFGTAVEPGVAHQIQSTATQKLVSTVREQEKPKRGFGLAPELPKFWRPTPGDMLVTDPYKAPDMVMATAGNTPLSEAKTILG